MDINVQELAALLSEERFKSGEESRSQLASSVPLIYRSMLSAPSITGMPLPDAAINMLAPVVGSAMGMPNARIMPQISQGMSPFEATYIANTNDQYVKNSREAFNFDMGGQLGQGFSQMANTLGFNRLFNMSPQQLNETMTRFGQSQIGGFFASQIMQSGPGQVIMGGDPWAMQANMFSNRMSFGVTPGSVMMPMDIGGQTGIAQHTQALTSELGRAIYPNGVTPNFNFTRGFRPEEIGDVATIMAQRGASTIGDSGETIAQGMRGADIDPRRKVQAVGEMTRVLESVRDLMGGGDLQQLMAALESLTNTKWPSINRPALEQTFREMAANAHILGVSGANMIEGTMQTQNILRNIYGIGPQQAELGVSAGGYTSPEAAAQLYTTNLAIASATGKPIGQVVAQQSAAMKMAANSQRGLDMTQIGYYVQEGLISPEAFDEFRKVTMMGDPNKADRMAQDLLSSAGGSRAISNDPMMMQQIRSNTSKGMAQIVNEMLVNGPGAELPYRLSQNIDRARDSSLSRIEGMSGIRLGDAERAAAQYAGAQAYLSSAAAGPDGGRLADILASVYDADNPVRGMGAVRRVMRGGEFDTSRSDLNRYMTNSVSEARTRKAVTGLSEGNTFMKAGLYQMGLYDVNDTDTALKALRDRFEANIVEERNGTLTSAMSKALDEAYIERASFYDKQFSGGVRKAGDRAVRDRAIALRRLEGQVNAGTAVDAGRAAGTSTDEIVASLNGNAGNQAKLNWWGTFKDTFVVDISGASSDARKAEGISNKLKTDGSIQTSIEAVQNEAAQGGKAPVLQKLINNAVEASANMPDKAHVKHNAVQTKESQGGGGDKQGSPTRLALSGRLELITPDGSIWGLGDAKGAHGKLSG